MAAHPRNRHDDRRKRTNFRDNRSSRPTGSYNSNIHQMIKKNGFHAGIGESNKTCHKMRFISILRRDTFGPQRIILRPRLKHKYKEELWKQISHHNIFEKSEAIYRRASDANDNLEEFTNSLNTIASNMQESMLHAEATCSKIPSAPYSEKMANTTRS